MVTRVRRNPAADFAYLFDQMDRMAEEIVGNSSGSRISTLPVDLCDTGEELVIRAFVPGLTSDQLELEVEQGVLTISGVLPPFGVKDEAESWTWYSHELRSGPFRRSINLPFKIAPGDISAKIENGVLWVRLSKAPEAKPFRISIEDSKSSVHELSATN